MFVEGFVSDNAVVTKQLARWVAMWTTMIRNGRRGVEPRRPTTTPHQPSLCSNFCTIILLAAPVRSILINIVLKGLTVVDNTLKGHWLAFIDGVPGSSRDRGGLDL